MGQTTQILEDPKNELLEYRNVGKVECWNIAKRGGNRKRKTLTSCLRLDSG